MATENPSVWFDYFQLQNLMKGIFDLHLSLVIFKLKGLTWDPWDPWDQLVRIPRLTTNRPRMVLDTALYSSFAWSNSLNLVAVCDSLIFETLDLHTIQMKTSHNKHNISIYLPYKKKHKLVNKQYLHRLSCPKEQSRTILFMIYSFSIDNFAVICSSELVWNMAPHNQLVYHVFVSKLPCGLFHSILKQTHLSYC